MTHPLQIVWGRHEIRVLQSFRRCEAERVDAAIIRFAETGARDVSHLPDDPPGLVRLYVGDYRVRMAG
jgi:hypothetical protein